ncbi:CDP-glycerol glycerophosphotransferase [Nocardioides sp. J9]|nr:CDP-glycerol glycerophosphotransferase [Nocardioides sp. J9]
MASAFGVPERMVHMTGLPRHDRLTVGISHGSGSRRHGLYLPTHRGEGAGSLEDLFDGIERLDDELTSLNASLRVKLHHYHGADSGAVQGLKNIEIVDDSSWNFDLQEELASCDFLVTDYSSVAIDFLVTGRPIVYFAPDLEKYLHTEGRGDFYYEYYDVVAGPICDSWGQVSDELSEMFSGRDAYFARRRHHAERFVPMSDGVSTSRVLELLKQRPETA